MARKVKEKVEPGTPHTIRFPKQLYWKLHDLAYALNKTPFNETVVKVLRAHVIAFESEWGELDRCPATLAEIAEKSNMQKANLVTEPVTESTNAETSKPGNAS